MPIARIHLEWLKTAAADAMWLLIWRHSFLKNILKQKEIRTILYAKHVINISVWISCTVSSTCVNLNGKLIGNWVIWVDAHAFKKSTLSIVYVGMWTWLIYIFMIHVYELKIGFTLNDPWNYFHGRVPYDTLHEEDCQKQIRWVEASSTYICCVEYLLIHIFKRIDDFPYANMPCSSVY